MKTKVLFLGIIMLMGVSVFTYAQPPQKSRTNNLHIGIAPVGYYNIHLSRKSDDVKAGYDYLFKTAFSVNLAFEKENMGMSRAVFFTDLSLLEFSFTKALFDKYEPSDNLRKDYPFPSEKDFIEASIDYYVGWNLVNQKKAKISFYLGPGVNYIKGDEISKISPEIATKLKLKFYISYKVGLFVGINGHLSGLSKVNDSVTLDGEPANFKFGMVRKSALAEAGFIIDLK